MRGIDAMYVDKLDVSSFDVVFVYGSAFGSTQGPARRTPPDRVRALRKPVWMIYFPGADPAKAIAEAQSFPNVVGVAMDLESRWEGDAWSRGQCFGFGDYCAGRMPRVLYAHRPTCNQLVPGHYDGSWFAGERRTAALGPHDAVQWGYFSSYDESVVQPWYANPRGAAAPAADPHQGATDMFDATPVKTRPTPSGGGAWIVTASGAIFTTGDAVYLGAINPGNGDGITRVGDVRDLHANPRGYTIETFDGKMVRFYAFPSNWAVKDGRATEVAPAIPATAG